MNLQIERLKRLPQSAHDVWQGGLLRLPLWVQDERGEAFRPWVAGWVSLDTKVVHISDPARRDEISPETALTTLTQFACDEKMAGYRPARVQVKDPSVADSLRGILADADIEVEIREELPEVKAVLADMVGHMCGQPSIPGATDVKGVTVDVMRAFAAAAAAFYRARPWKLLTAEDYIEIESSPASLGPRGAAVLGAGGKTIGLGFFESRDDLLATVTDADPDDILSRQPWSLFFESIEDLPPLDADLWEEHDLPLASAEAYPVLIRMEPEERATRPGVEMIAHAQGLMQALASATEQEIDTGRWSRQVDTVKGPVEYVLSLPDLLEQPEPQAEQGSKPPVAFNPLMMDQFAEKVKRSLEGHDFANEHEMNAFLTENMGSLFDGVGASTPQEQATQLVYQAYDAKGRRQLQLIRQALEIWPDCADAHVLLGERTCDPSEALEHYTRGMEAAERTLGGEVFEEDAGHFWGLVETRPYMRARYGVAQSLEALDRLDEATEHYRELLALNPNDNQGVREELMVCLLRTNGHEELEELLKAYKDDKGLAMWNYTRALLTFQQKGNTPTARKHLRQAFENNELIPDYLLELEPFPPAFPSSYAPGSEEEAVLCADALMGAWHQTPGAIDWLDKAFEKF